MHPTPTTRHRHALRWVLGVGLVFVVVVGMALQVARRRAEERWNLIVDHWLDNRTSFLVVALEHHNEMKFDLQTLEVVNPGFEAWESVPLIHDHREFVEDFGFFSESTEWDGNGRLRIIQDRHWFGEQTVVECYYTENWHEALLEELSGVFEQVGVECTAVDLGWTDE